MEEDLTLAYMTGFHKRDDEVRALKTETARLQAAHDHQRGVADTMLREAERVGRENDQLRKALYALVESVDVVCVHSDGDRRQWAGVCWLHPGEALVNIDLAPLHRARTLLETTK
jgi:hypothetical protein